MNKEININKLIQAAEDIVHDNQIGFAAEIRRKVQEVEHDESTYVLFVLLTEKNLLYEINSRSVYYNEDEENIVEEDVTLIPKGHKFMPSGKFTVDYLGIKREVITEIYKPKQGVPARVLYTFNFKSGAKTILQLQHDNLDDYWVEFPDQPTSLSKELGEAIENYYLE